MKALDAAYQVLVQANEPLHAREMVRRMIEQGLWQTTGRTPEATIDSCITVDMKHQGEASRFRRAGKRTFTVHHAAVIELSSSALSTELEDAQPSAVPTIALPSPQALSFVDAAERVLADSGLQQPMHYQEITRRALDLGLIETAGQTPAASMYAVILTEIDKMTKRGEQPRFAKHGKGRVSLAKWQAEHHGLAALIEQQNRRTRSELHSRLYSLKPAEFEALIGRLLTALGFEAVAVTPLNGDGGIDVRGTLVVGDVIRTKMADQVKRWKKNVQAPIIQQVRGGLGAHEQGLIITTSDFSSGARIEAARPDATPVALMHGEQLVNLLIEHDIGVRRTNHDLIELSNADELE